MKTLWFGAWLVGEASQRLVLWRQYSVVSSEEGIRRRRALKEICPCRVREDVDEFWERVFEMVEDDSAEVRAQVLHTLCDGSPAHLEDRVADSLESFNRDPDKKIRRQAHKVLASYRKTGKWNIL